VQTFFDHYRISFDETQRTTADGAVLFAALDLANRRSIAIPKSAQFSLTARPKRLERRDPCE
jgi:acyl-CoA thioesterase FadM